MLNYIVLQELLKLFSTFQKFWYSLYIVINFVSHSQKINHLGIGFLIFSSWKKRLNEISRKSPLPLFLLLFAASIWKRPEILDYGNVPLAKAFYHKATHHLKNNGMLWNKFTKPWWNWWNWRVMTLMTLNLKCHKSYIVIKDKEVKIVKKVKRSDGLGSFPCADVYYFASFWLSTLAI